MVYIAIPAFRRLKQDDHSEFEATLINIVNLRSTCTYRMRCSLNKSNKMGDKFFSLGQLPHC